MFVFMMGIRIINSYHNNMSTRLKFDSFILIMSVVRWHPYAREWTSWSQTCLVNTYQ